VALMADEVLDFLEAQGLIGGATGWTGFAHGMPPDPDQVIVLYETGGSPPEMRPQGSTETLLDQITFQIRGRGSAHGDQALRGMMGEVYRALHDGDLGDQYTMVRALQSGPLSLGHDEQSRPEMTINFEAYRDRDADT